MPQLRGERQQIRDRLRLAAEFARQVAHRIGAAEGDPNQQRGAGSEIDELAQLIRIVDDESRHAERQRGADVAVALDRMRMDAALGGHAEAAHQVDFAVGREIEIGARRAQRVDDRGVRQRLDRVVQIDSGQCRREPPVLRAHPARHR